jgi:hypothetical protein
MKDERSAARPSDGDRANRDGRRPYRKPRLTEFGSIAKLTQGTSTRQSDGPGGGFKHSCL